MTDFDYSRVVYDSEGALRTADVLALAPGDLGWEALLIVRGTSPHKGQYAAPGGFMEKAIDGGPAAAAVRELVEETGLVVAPPRPEFEEASPVVAVYDELMWLGKYNAPGRDPRFQTATEVYVALLTEKPSVLGGDDAESAEFVPFYDLVRRVEDGEKVLAFDHDLYILDLSALLKRFEL